MKHTREIRKLLNQLTALGVLIDYTLHARYGQSVMIYDAQGVPRIMTLLTAKAAARHQEMREWWG